MEALCGPEPFPVAEGLGVVNFGGNNSMNLGSRRRKRPSKVLSVRKSCDFCYRRKTRCDGDGINRCSFCILKGQELCVYSKRQGKGAKFEPNTVPAHPGSVASDKSNSLQHQARCASLKRCHLSPSPATGLVGMLENDLLSTYFHCLGFVRIISQSTIRQAIVKIMLAVSATAQSKRRMVDSNGWDDLQANGADLAVSDARRWYGGTSGEGNEDTSVVAAAARASMDTSISLLWCAVALGGLVQGRSMASVATYVQRAEEAMAHCAGTPTADVARIYTAMGLLLSFTGDRERSANHFERAAKIVAVSDMNHIDQDFVFLVTCIQEARVLHNETTDLAQLKAFSESRSLSSLRLNRPITNGALFYYISNAQRRLVQAMLKDIEPGDANPASGDIIDDAATGAEIPDDANFDKVCGLSKGVLCERVAVPGSKTGSTVSSPKMAEMSHLQEAAVHLEDLHEVVNKAGIQTGIGGFIINSGLVKLKEAQQDQLGAMENIARCVDILVRFPGLCNMRMAMHSIHCITLSLAAAEERETYRQLADAFNAVRFPGTQPIPPIEERLTNDLCDDIMCSWMQKSIKMPQAVRYMITKSPGDGVSADNVSAAALQDVVDCALPEEFCNLHAMRSQPNTHVLVEDGAEITQELADLALVQWPDCSGNVATAPPSVDTSSGFGGSDLDHARCEATDEDLATEDWLGVAEALLTGATTEDGTGVGGTLA